MPNRQRELQAMLQSLRLPTMAEVCAELARNRRQRRTLA
jgi:hypothetical protein